KPGVGRPGGQRADPRPGAPLLRPGGLARGPSGHRAPFGVGEGRKSRMVLESYRAKVQPYIARLARPFLGWSPGNLSLLALLCAVAAGGTALLVRWTTPYLFLAVAALIFLAGLFDVLDGEVARQTSRASVGGDFVDHVYDRYADVAILLGFAVSTYANPFLALVSLLLVSYMGTQAQALGQGRLYAGLLSRADRLVVLAVAAFLEFDWSLPCGKGRVHRDRRRAGLLRHRRPVDRRCSGPPRLSGAPPGEVGAAPSGT